MAGNGFDAGIDVGIEVPLRIAMPQVVSAMNDVPEVRNDAGLAEPIAVFVVVEAHAFEVPEAYASNAFRTGWRRQ